MNDYYDNETFNKVSFTTEQLSRIDFDTCVFNNCNFSDLHLINSEFLECEFTDCNFSNARLKDSSFKDTLFVSSKLIGVKFYEVDPFLLRMNFRDCQLDYASFYRLQMPNFQFVDCSIREVDFTQADAKQAYFDNCDLLGSVFEETNLEQTNFKTSRNFSIDLETNRLKGAVFSKDNVVNLLEKYKIKVEK